MAPYAADVFSRKIVAWQIFAEESSEHASNIMQDLCWREHIRSNQVTLHSDNVAWSLFGHSPNREDRLDRCMLVN